MTSVKYPDIKVHMIGEDGNAFSILARVMKEMRRFGLSKEQIDEFHVTATSGDYDHLLQTVLSYVKVY